MTNVVSMDHFRERKQEQQMEQRTGASVLLGGETGSICPNCNAVLYHAMLMPHAVEGKACRECSTWYDGE